jgi:hypothetical protein
MTDHAQEITDGIGVADPTGPDGLTDEERASLLERGVVPFTTGDVPDPDPDIDHDEVKGPDPAVWGPDEDRPNPNPTYVDPVDDNGNPMEVKGPDPDVWG